MHKESFIFNNKQISKILVVGLGISGISVVKFLEKYNLTIDTFDTKNTQQEFTGIDLENYDLICISPGIPLNNKGFTNLHNYKNKWLSDIDIFAGFFKNKIIAITGSNGKSTVVTMLDFVLNKLGKKSFLGGNIGTPALLGLKNTYDIAVLELSSFQLDLLHTQKNFFDIGYILNITPDHLDRYADFQDYILSKLSLEKFSKKFLIYDASGVECYTNNLFYSNLKIINDYIYLDDEMIIDFKQSKLSGNHNLENIVVVLDIVLKLNLGVNIHKIIECLLEFTSLAHRCNSIGFINEVEYINDSKSTNVASTLAALKGLGENKNILLLLGGLSKRGNFTVLKNIITEKVKLCIVYGKDKEIITTQLDDIVPLKIANSFAEAINLAKDNSQKNDIVLLSPACASFDMFKGFEHRGECFEKLVNSNKIKD